MADENVPGQNAELEGAGDSGVPQISITPTNIILAGGQAVTFKALDDKDKPLEVNWEISPKLGAFAPASGTASRTFRYIAPAQVTGSQSVVVIATATRGEAAATATINLTAVPVEITPNEVTLKLNQSQQFNAVVAGDPANAVTWNTSAKIGKIEEGLYTATEPVEESTTVTVIATSSLGKKTGRATVTLVPPPWTGRWRNILGAYLLAVFSLVFLLLALWPPAVPEQTMAKAARSEAEKNAAEKAQVWKDAQNALDEARTAATNATNKVPAEERVKIATADRDRAQTASKLADEDLSNKEAIATEAASPTVKAFWWRISRATDILLLVLLSGALGSFLHSARSFADFVGNRRISGSWAWWYFLHPFMGAILALIFYMAVCGGFFVVTGGGANVQAADLSAYGVAAVATLVGMFSNQATQKLADVFDTLFKPSSGKELKDPLNHPAQTATVSGPAGAAVPGGATPAVGQAKKS